MSVQSIDGRDVVHKAARRDGFDVALRRPRPEVFRAFEVTTLDRLLPRTDEPKEIPRGSRGRLASTHAER